MSVRRFFLAGLDDVDRRFAAAMAPPPLAAADRYLHQSTIVKSIDRATVRLDEWWRASQSRRLFETFLGMLAGDDSTDRYRAFAMVILIAAAVYFALTLAQGLHHGWFWIVIPSMAAVFASLMFIGSSRSNH